MKYTSFKWFVPQSFYIVYQGKALLFYIINKMFYTKSIPKGKHKEEDIQPWNAEESNMLNLIIESADIHPKLTKNIGNHILE